MSVIVRGMESGSASGTVLVSGAKNAALPLLFGALALPGVTRLENVPLSLRDVQVAQQILTSLGVSFYGRSSLDVDTSALRLPAVLPAACDKIRYSVLLLGALLPQFGRITLPLPGGCKLGAQRPIDFHLAGLSAFGAHVTTCSKELRVRLGTVKDASYALPFPSVTATQNLMLLAAQSRGTQVIENCATEPEVRGLADFLVAGGAKVQWLADRVLSIGEPGSLHGAAFEVCPDRIEAGTFVALAVLLRSDVVIEPVVLEHLQPLLDLLAGSGLSYLFTNGRLVVRGASLPAFMPGLHVIAEPHPGFPTDLQPLAAAAALGSRGPSVIIDHTFPDRYAYLPELSKLGARAERHGCALIVHPSLARLRGATVHCHDIRSGAAVLLAALAARGTSTLSGEEQIERGYETIWEKLRKLGAQIRRGSTVASRRLATGGLARVGLESRD